MTGLLEHHDFGRRLKRQLSWPLPGTDAQIRLSPEPRIGWTPGHVPHFARVGAGLVLLYLRDGRRHTVLTLRNAALNQHAGQLSLPGGASEPGESLADAALREANEEIGLALDAVEVVGQLTPLYIPVSRFALHPVVAIAEQSLSFEPDAGEVQQLYEIDLEYMRDSANRDEEMREHAGRQYRVPYVRVEDQKLWGATAMVYSELFAVFDALECEGR